ncbi:uncharacterized protein E0L32_003821 [Thyridium curvatum]|uniref:4-coumarate--CoA ligase n=1 Tax=Thyridium curvatum TaxID=1093900 RepID=A0A507B9K4_9PEZI|nr:uncharacterized protein E0L32_003821 [Thyridium curvatum]TPX16527.1 hypothetical protein E0L32_003821 [Thyridium curvatum]
MLAHPSPDLIASNARTRANNLACVELSTGLRWSYGELDTDVQRAVTILRSVEGVRAGDRVAVLDQNSVYQLIIHQALLRIGAIFVPVNWRLSSPEIARILEDCSPVLFYSRDTHVRCQQARQRCRSFSSFTKALQASPPAPPIPISPAFYDKTGTILYTSGTSGSPKGVMLTPRCLLATATNYAYLGEVSTGCVFLCDCPMYHIIGLVVQVWAPLLRGGTLLVSPGFDAAQTNRRLADQDLGVTHYFCVPQMATMLRYAEGFAPEKWTALKALFTGGAPNPPANILWWLDRGVKMVDGYGMTEAATTVGMPLDGVVIRAKAGSAGTLAPQARVRIVDLLSDGGGADGGCRDVPDGEAGEILVRGPHVTPGYWNRPAETAAAFTEDGWLRTGDIARRDGDGFVFILDRRKDMYIRGGENVYSAEVEAVLIAHPDVQDVAVVGVPDEQWGESGRAYVVLEPGGRIDGEELRLYCDGQIARYKIPKEVKFVEALPRTPSGKVMKHLLRGGMTGRRVPVNRPGRGSANELAGGTANGCGILNGV